MGNISYNRISRKVVLKTLSILSICITFFSCTNFMNGSDLKQKIDEAVEYANASSYPILVTSNYGKISPNGIVDCKKSDSINIMFTADSDYQFIRWHVVDKSTGQEIENQDYITFENEMEISTSFTFEKINPEINFVVEPYCEIRPAVVSTSPLYDSNGVYRDRRIIVMFDRNMSESSIYYDSDEQTELLDKGYTLLKDEKHENKCYGYWDGFDNSTIRFKNILITKRTNTNENFLQYYKAPYFDENDSSKIIIESKKDNPPLGGTEILVTIEGKMCFSKEYDGIEKTVSIGSKYRWSYYTNGREDSDPPVFNSIDVRFASENQSEYNSSATKLAENILTISNDPTVGIPKYNHKPRNLWVKGDFTDSGSGPASLKWAITKIDDKYYPSHHNIEVLSGNIDGDDFVQTGNTVLIGKNSGSSSKGILINYKNSVKDEGLYRFSLTASDNNGCENVKNYYFIYDETPPEKIKINWTGGKNKKVTLNYTTSSNADYAYHMISQGSDSNTRYENHDYDKPNTVITNNKTNVENNKTYSYYLKAVDYAGNISDTTVVEETAGAAPGTICYAPGNKTSDIFCSKNYYAGQNPIGVVCDNSDLSKVKIWDLTEATGYCWGYNGDPCSNEVLKGTWNDSRNTASGLDWYNYIKNNKPGHINYQNGSKDNCRTIWYYLENVKNVNSPVTWYIPGVTEFNGIINNYYAMQNSYNLLKDNGHSATLFTEQKPYWTGCPRYKKPYANAVMLNKTNGGIYDNIASNGDGLKLYLTGEKREDSWYYKDEWQCEKSENQAALITHAMAQVNMN